MKGNRQGSVFGRRREPHTVIIAHGDRISHFTIRPWLVMFLGSALAAIAIGYLLATTYLVLRDDLIGASAARQARIQQAYEDRISMLRTQLDRVASRQMLDQRLVETKVGELLERQDQLTRRHGRIGPILDRLEGAERPQMPESMPVPRARPDLRARLGSEKSVAVARVNPLLDTANPLIDTAKTARLEAFWPTREATRTRLSVADESDRLFVEINRSLREIETEQIAGIELLAANANAAADEIATALEEIGLPLDEVAQESGTGGPLIPIGPQQQDFDASISQLDAALEHLEALKAAARRMPVFNPSPGHSISSGFGPRRDPFIGRPAFHSGIDFRAPSGAPVKSAGAGTVVSAGWNGGYGRMVEVEHGGGITTRYAHMSRISVSTGDKVETGTVLGRVGSTGRSTGPHLHFEVRKSGKAVDPRPFLRAGRKIADLI